MFGVGIFEILVIIIVAIIALGPNKLPQTIVDIVKFFRAVKKTLAEAKDTFDKEIQLSEIKQEALKYKENITNEVNKLTQDIKLDELREIRTDSITKPFEDALKETSSSLQGALDSLNAPLEQSSIPKPQSISESSTATDSEPPASLSYASAPNSESSLDSSPQSSSESNPIHSPIHQMAQENIMRESTPQTQSSAPHEGVNEGANAQATPPHTATKG